MTTTLETKPTEKTNEKNVTQNGAAEVTVFKIPTFKKITRAEIGKRFPMEAMMLGEYRGWLPIVVEKAVWQDGEPTDRKEIVAEIEHTFECDNGDGIVGSFKIFEKQKGEHLKTLEDKPVCIYQKAKNYFLPVEIRVEGEKQFKRTKHFCSSRTPSYEVVG